MKTQLFRLAGFAFFLLLGNLPINAQNCNGDIPLTTPSLKFTDNNDGTVTDNQTGLMWMRCSLGQNWSENNCSGTVSQLDWQVALESSVSYSYAGNTDWRLPNVKELLSLIEIACNSPAINEVLFPATPTEEYWTSTPASGDSKSAWYINFDHGHNRAWTKTVPKLVRLVRGGL